MFTRGELEAACGAAKVHGQIEYCPFHLQRDGKKEREGLGCVIVLFDKSQEGSVEQEASFPTVSLNVVLGLLKLNLSILFL